MVIHSCTIKINVKTLNMTPLVQINHTVVNCYDKIFKLNVTELIEQLNDLYVNFLMFKIQSRFFSM